MAPLPWLVMLESLAYQQLMKSPTFHRAVEQVVKRVDRARHGVHPDDLGGTNLDEPDSRFGRHFMDELRTQLGTAEKEKVDGTRIQGPRPTENVAASSSTTSTASDAESAWRTLNQRSGEPPKEAPVDDYLARLRGQINQQQKPK